jgi:flagellar export protein FliJ
MAKAFPLQTVLEQRGREEEQRQMALAQAEAELAQVQALARQRAAQRDAAMHALKLAQHAAAVDGYALQASMQHLARAEGALTQVHLAVQQHAATVATARSSLVQASQARLALERLRDAFHADLRALAERTESERLGEMALHRWRNQHEQ